MKLAFYSFEMVLLVSACGFLLNTYKTSSVLAMRRETRRVCGAQLVEMLETLCGPFGYNEMNKRFDSTETDDDFDNQLPSASYPYLSKSAATIWAKRSELHKRMNWGIVDRCCYRQCTTRELLSYCLPNANTRATQNSRAKRMARLARDY